MAKISLQGELEVLDLGSFLRACCSCSVHLASYCAEYNSWPPGSAHSIKDRMRYLSLLRPPASSLQNHQA